MTRREINCFPLYGGQGLIVLCLCGSQCFPFQWALCLYVSTPFFHLQTPFFCQPKFNHPLVFSSYRLHQISLVISVLWLLL